MKTKNIEILLLDDNEVDLKLTRDILNNDKLVNKIHCFRDPVEASKYLMSEGSDIDLVIVDMNLKDSTGLDFIRSAKELNLLKNKPIVILSGVHDASLEIEADLLGVSLWVEKPLSLKKLHFLVLSIPNFFMSAVLQEKAC